MYQSMETSSPLAACGSTTAVSGVDVMTVRCKCVVLWLSQAVYQSMETSSPLAACGSTTAVSGVDVMTVRCKCVVLWLSQAVYQSMETSSSLAVCGSTTAVSGVDVMMVRCSARRRCVPSTVTIQESYQENAAQSATVCAIAIYAALSK